MKRGEFLRLSGAEVGRYKVLRQRGRLPFGDAPEELEPEHLQKQSTFTLEECIQMRMMLDVIDHHGLDPIDAQKFVGNAWPRARAHCGDNLERLASGDVWVGWAMHRRDDQPRHPVQWEWDVGSAVEVAAFLANDKRSEVHPYRLFMANVSDAARVVLSRVEAAA